MRAAIIIASPLDAGPRSIYRLFREFDGYLRHLGCDGTPPRRERPDEKKPITYVSIHRESHPDVLELLNSIGDYVSQRGARLQISMTE